MKKERINHQFGPIYDDESEILILGSFPSVKSRADDFYYMHPQNRFWELLEIIYNDNFTRSNIVEKKLLLNKHHIALYDVIESCTIQGSSDSSIKNVKVSDIEKIKKNSLIKQIYLNGRKAESIFLEHFNNLKSYASYLPSTSPANARYSIEDLFEEWKKIKKPR